MAAAHSPSSSPRLPSPPPIAEDQLGPASPGVALLEEHGKLPNNAIDTGASRRIRPGTKAEDMAEGPPLVELHEIDSAFQLTEHLKALHYHHTHPPNTDTTNPISPEIAKQLAQPPSNTSREIWLYELGRFLIQKTNSIIVALFADTPPCSPQTCSEMRASEWQYLCAVHDPPKSCAAIDYCCHTLDWAATTLTSSKMFPSRLGLGSGAAGVGAQNSDKVLQHQIKELTNIFRRVYRIYAHAWFQHREMFWRVEGKTGLYVLFKTVCDEYGLIQAENYTIPPEAEGLQPAEPVSEERTQLPTSVLERPGKSEEGQESVVGENRVLAAGNTTKRHMRTPSSFTDSAAVIKEEEEEEEPETEIDERKPSLERQATELKAFAESLPQPGQKTEVKHEDSGEEKTESGQGDTQDVHDGAASEPSLGIQRSDTVKPHHRDIEAEAEAEEAKESGNVETTVVEVKPEEAKEAAKETPVVEVEGESKMEVMEPEAPAKEPQEAVKSVAD